MVLKNPFLSIAGVDLSAYVQELTPSFNVDKPDATCGNTQGVKAIEAGLEAATVKVKFKQAFGAGLVHETLKANHKAVVAIEFRYSAAAAGPTNPKCTGNALCIYEPSGGAVGTVITAGCELTFDGAYTWANA
ncbi:MAG: hypothetical protein KBA95_01870 [Acidobacteria bacterium]|nr:hypothetical protein [Acidobacteriota bacterium]